MRGNFDNSVEWLENMPPSVFSTKATGEKLTKALHQNTRREWIVKLVPARQKCGGGFFIGPPEDRLVDGKIGREDWAILRALFGALPYNTRRWYLFPDEISSAFQVLGVKITIGPADPD